MPRTMESSTTTSRLPAMASGSGFSLRRTASARSLLVRRDERPADVAVLHQPLAVGDPAGPGEALGRGDPRLGHAHDHVGVRRRLEPPAARPCGSGSRGPRGRRGGCRGGRCRRTRRCTAAARRRAATGPRGSCGPSRVDHHQLARLDLAHEGGADDAQSRRLRGQHPALGRVGRAETAEAQRPEAERVAYPEEPLRAHQDEGERALEDRQHRLQRGRRGPRSRGTNAPGARRRRRCRSRSNRAACRPSRPARRCWSGCRCGRARSRPCPPAGRRAGRRPSPRHRASSSGCDRWRGGPGGPRGCARRTPSPPGPCP